MNWNTGLAWLAAFARPGLARLPGEVDHADMGTAFGLDASLHRLDGTDAAAVTPAPRSAGRRWDRPAGPRNPS